MTSLTISSRLRGLPASETLAINTRVQSLRASGLDVLNFSVGEPDFPTPERIREAGIRAIQAGRTRYTPVPGILELREAIVDRLELDYGVRWSPQQVCASNGGKQALYNVFQALLEPGDEVLIPAPYWLTYPPQVVLAGGVPVIVPSAEGAGFQPDIERLEAACTARTRLLVLNSPSNPTGVVLSDRVLEQVAALALRRDLLILTDDLYYRLVYGNTRFVSIAALSPEIHARTIVVGGLSKAYAMTGWRLGYAVGPAEVIAAVTRLQGQSTSNPCSISQLAGVEALREDPRHDDVARMVSAFGERRQCMLEALREIPGITCVEPHGAFYTFPNVLAYLGKRAPGGAPLQTSPALAEYLLESVQVAAIPGSVFGAPSHLRFSYACSLDEIRRGIARVREALQRLSD